MMKVRIKDIGRVVTGRTPPTANSEFWGGSVPFITPEDLQRGKDIVSTKRTITSEGLSVVGTASIPKGSVCVSCIGNIGYTGITTTQSVSNQQINSIVPNADYDCGYVYYLMRVLWPHFKILEGNATTVPILNKSDFESLEVEVLPTAERRRVASILSALDRKIALNRKKIATLEKMAKEIYDYWFVQYDFPDANGRPYKSSGGEMVYSPELKREIPKEWKVGCLGDVVDVNRRSHNVRTLPEHINYIDISSTQSGFVGAPTKYSRDDAPGRARRIVADGDVVWSCVRPNLKAFALILSPKDEDVFSTGFAVLSPREIPYSYLYCTTSTDNFVPYLVAKTGNSAYPAVLPGDFKLYQLALPPADLLAAFHTSVGPMFRRRQRCFDEISKLTALRDSLLPLLMNGQVRIGGMAE